MSDTRSLPKAHSVWIRRRWSILSACILASGAAGFGISSALARHERLSSREGPALLVAAGPSFPDVIARARPMMVAIRDLPDETGVDGQARLQTKRSPYEMPGRPGVIIGPDGWIVTTAGSGSSSDAVEVATSAGARFDARVAGIDPDTGLTLLKADEAGLPYEMLNAREARVGEWVVLLGTPGPGAGPATAGFLSARGPEPGTPWDDVMEVEAPFRNAAAGSAVFNIDGDLAGLVIAPAAQAADMRAVEIALPARALARITEEIKQTSGSSGSPIAAPRRSRSEGGELRAE